MPRTPPIESTIAKAIKSGQYPDPEWLANYQGISADQAYAAMVEHRANTNWGEIGISTPEMPSKPKNILLDETTEPVHTDEMPKKQSIHDIPKDILKGIFAILSVLCAIRSWGFIYGWFAQWDSGFFSGILACVLTGCLIVMPQAIMILSRERRWIFVVVCSLVVVVSVAFSMITTIGGLYNDRSKSITEKTKADNSASSAAFKLSQLELEYSRIMADRQADIDENKILQQNLQKVEVGTYEYNRTVNRIDVIKRRIDQYDTRLVANEHEKNVSSNESNDGSRNDFFQFVSKIMGRQPDEIEFSTSVIVSLIVDVSGPVFATLALFL